MMILGIFGKRVLTTCVALCVLGAGWAYADDFTETLENVGKSYGAGNVPDTRLYVQDLLKILDDQEALLVTKCVIEDFSSQWEPGEATIQTGGGGGLVQGGLSYEQRFTTEDGKSRGMRARAGSGEGGAAKHEILQTQGYVTLKIKKGAGNLENMLGGLGKLFGAQNTRKGRFIKIGGNRGNIEFQESNFKGTISLKVGEEINVEAKGRHIDKGQLVAFTENVLDWPCINKLPQ